MERRREEAALERTLRQNGLLQLRAQKILDSNQPKKGPKSYAPGIGSRSFQDAQARINSQTGQLGGGAAGLG